VGKGALPEELCTVVWVPSGGCILWVFYGDALEGPNTFVRVVGFLLVALS